MRRLPPRPALSWTENGSPRSEDADDIFFAGDGLAETRAVFIAGCGLPEGWDGCEHYTVGELGFGSGLNILALWDMWRRHRPSPQARLSVLSFEHSPMTAEEAARVHAPYPEIAGLSQTLTAKWPERARGVQRIELGDGVALTLAIDDALTALRQTRASVDAWFLDGFAPSKNPDMWSAEVFAELVRLSAPNARLATYTVAGVVRRGLAAAGFDVRRLPGHGGKRERLEASIARPVSPDTSRDPEPNADTPEPVALDPGVRRDERDRLVRTVIVVGAGVAGATAAGAFRRRGASVTVIDAGMAPGAGASGNPVALVAPRLDAADTPAGRGLLEAWLLARRLYGSLGEDCVQAVDAVRLPDGESEGARFAKLLGDPPLEETLVRPLDVGRHEAGLVTPAFAVRTASALERLLEGCETRFGVRVAGFEDAQASAVCVLDTGERLTADLVVICAGDQLPALGAIESPAIEGRLGQLEFAALGNQRPSAVADGGYALTSFGQLVFGATFERAPEGEPPVTGAARAHNLDILNRLRPDIDPSALELGSRAAIRATTQDRLPFAGPPLAQVAPACIRLIGGLGSRGWLWAPLLAEIVASEVHGEPGPCEASILDALSPDRFRLRALRKRV